MSHAERPIAISFPYKNNIWMTRREREREREASGEKVLNAPDRARLIAPSIPYSILLLLLLLPFRLPFFHIWFILE